MSAHTPGPWEVMTIDDEIRYNLPRGTIYCVMAKIGKYPATICSVEEYNEVNEAIDRSADARLIAASPDLYAALVNARSFIATDRASLVECCAGPDGEVDEYDASAIATYDELLAQIDAAISKAGGKT